MTKQLCSVEKTRSIDNLLLSSVDEMLKQVFNEAGAKVIYDYIESKCHLKREENAEKTEVFSTGLERLLVSAGPVIEKMISRNLYSKLELEFVEKKGEGFSSYVKELRKNNGKKVKK